MQAGRPSPDPEMALALLRMGAVRTLRTLGKVRGFGRRRRSNLRAAMRWAAQADRMSALLEALTAHTPNNPPIVVHHPLGPDAHFAPVVAPRLIAVPLVVPVPDMPPGFPADHPQIVTFRQALQRPVLPRHIIILGGNYAGTELAVHWLAAGHQITIVHPWRHLLAGHLPAPAEAIHDEVVAAGAVVLTDAAPVAWRPAGNAVSVVVETWDGQAVVVGDLIVVA